MTILFHNGRVQKLAHVLMLLVHCLLQVSRSSSFHLREGAFMSNAIRGGSVVTLERNNGTLDTFENGTSIIHHAVESDTLDVTDKAVTMEPSVSNSTTLGTKPMKVLFLSADTGGGHRASAQSLMHQVRISLGLTIIFV